MTKNHYPLEGVTVLDFGQVYHGPYCGFLLAMAGAHVIKIEPKTGEHLRNRGTGDIITLPLQCLTQIKMCDAKYQDRSWKRNLKTNGLKS